MKNTEDAPRGSVETRFYPIHAAARMRDVDTVRKELESGVDVDLLNGKAANGDGGNTALWFAAQGPLDGGLAVAEVLLEAGADINRACEHGCTALHMAAAWGHVELVEWLLEKGADATLHDDDNRTPAMMARTSERVPKDRLQEVLVCLGADKA